MLGITFGLLFVTSLALGSELNVDLVLPDANDNENEFVSVKLAKIGENGIKSDIDVTVQLRIHVIDGKVHLNGNEMQHDIVNAVHMKLSIVELQNGIESEPRLAPVHLRILVLERVGIDGKISLFVEEEFLSIEDFKVEQLIVHRVGWENMIKKPTEQVSLMDSNIHQIPKQNDMHRFYDVGEPKYPEHGFKYDESEMHSSFFSHHWHKCHEQCLHLYCNSSQHDKNSSHHHHHEKHNHEKHHEHLLWHKFCCWYRCLSFRSKIALYLVSSLTLITFSVCCYMCIRRRRMTKVLLLSQTPLNDSVNVDVKEAEKNEKKTSDQSFDFHFQFDNDVVVSDTEKLIA